jgi:glycopeptide antibiotics resistance protein
MPIKKTALWMIFLLYLAYLIWVLYFNGFYNRSGMGTDIRTCFEMNTNFIPFETIHRYLRNISNDVEIGSALINLLGNLAAFMPMGLFLPLIFPPMRSTWKFVAVLLLVLVGAEGMQLLLRVGSCDVDDVILNLTGAMIIFGLAKLPKIQKRLKRLY